MPSTITAGWSFAEEEEEEEDFFCVAAVGFLALVG
jgi:hypothetical protein